MFIGIAMSVTAGLKGGGFSPATLFTNGEPGLWLDPSDAANLNWRYNLLTWTEGTVAQLDNASNVTNATTTITGFQNSIQFGDNSVSRWAYKTFTMSAGVAYVFSCYVQMDDGSAPVVGAASNLGDFSITVDTNLVSSGADISVTLVSGSLYRVTGRVASATAGSRNNGVVKFNTQSAKGFRVTGYQLQTGSVATEYQPITTVDAGVIARFPNATLYQDIAGTTPVTTPGQPVGLALDKSKNLALGPELFTRTLDFSSGVWLKTAAVTSSGFQTFTTNAQGGVYSTIVGVSASARYRVRVTGSTTAQLVIRNDTDLSGQALVPAGSFDVTLNSQIFSGSSGLFFQLTAAGTATITSVSIRELAGNHATQNTNGSRPLYALLPSNGIRNMANGSADTTNFSVWTTSGTANGITITRSGAGTDTDGLPFADYTVAGTATAADRRFITSGFRIPASVGQQFAISTTVQRTVGSAPPAGCGVSVDVLGETAPVTYVEGGGNLNLPVEAATPTTFTRTYTLANAASNQANGVVTIETANGATVNYTIRIKALQMELGSTRTAYQFNYARTNISQPPFSQVGALLFDGTDDFLQTPNVDFSGGGISGPNILTGTWLLTVDGGTATATESPPGTLNLTGDGTNGANAYQTVTTQVGRTYRVDFTTGGSASTIQIGTVQGGNDLFAQTAMNVGVNCVYFTATTTSASIWFRKAAAVLSTVSGITVREAIRPADEMTIFSGVRKLSDATLNAIIAEVGNVSVSTVGTASVLAPGANTGSYGAASRGSLSSSASSGAGSFPAPDTSVLTMSGDISADILSLRRNGTGVFTFSGDQGTGNYSNVPIYVGMRAGSSLPFNGYIYSLIVRGAQSTAYQISSTELWVASRTGFLPPVITGVPTVGVS